MHYGTMHIIIQITRIYSRKYVLTIQQNDLKIRKKGIL